MFLIVIIAIVILWASKKAIGQYGKPFSNNFVFMSITLFILIFVTGIIGISYLYESEYPDKIYGDHNITGVCYGYKHKDIHVTDDYMNCTLNMSGLQYNEIRQITAIREVNYDVDNRKEEWIPIEYPDKNKKLLSMWVPLKYPGINLVILKIEYVGNNSLETESPVFPRFNVLTTEQYSRRQYEKFGLYALLLSIAATVSFSGVRSFMEIWKDAGNKNAPSTPLNNTTTPPNIQKIPARTNKGKSKSEKKRKSHPKPQRSTTASLRPKKE